MLDIDFKMYKKTTIARVKGELDLVFAEKFRKEVDSVMEQNCSDNILLNLENVKFIDSSGLGVILGRYKKISLRGGKMIIVSAPPQVKKILELSGILKISESYDSETDALQAM